MSIQAIYSGSPGKPEPIALSDTSETDLFTRTNGRERFAGFSAVNTDSSNACLLTVYYNDGSTSFAIWRTNIAANSSELVTDMAFSLPRDSSAKFTAQAGTGGDITITPIIMFAAEQGRQIG